MERIFRIVSRINSALFLLLVLGIGGFILFEVASSARWQPSGEVTAVEKEDGAREVKLHFGDPERIIGATTMMLPLIGTPQSDGLIGSKSEYGDTRNALFVKADGDATWLFAGNGNRIFEVNQISETTDLKSYRNYDPDASDQGPTRLLLIGFAASEDDSADGRRRNAPMRIALAKPDGSGLVEVLNGVDSLLGHWLSPSGDLMVVYQKGSAVHRAHYAIDGFREISNTAIAAIPNTL